MKKSAQSATSADKVLVLQLKKSLDFPFALL